MNKRAFKKAAIQVLIGSIWFFYLMYLAAKFKGWIIVNW